jgi:hypothetical protein
MFANGGMNDTAIEQNLGGIGDAIEHAQGLFVLVIVIVTECLHPSLYLLPKCQYSAQLLSFTAHTCFSDMAARGPRRQ